MLIQFLSTRSLVAGLCISLAILLFIIAYRYYLAKYGKKNKLQGSFFELHRLEANPVSGEVELYFSLTEEKEASMELLNEQFQHLKELASGSYKKGGHIIRIDTTSLQNGTYYYQLRTDNQKTFRQMVVQNETKG